MPLVTTARDSERMLRTITQKKTKNKKNTRFNEVRQFAYIFGAEGREVF